MSRFFPGREDWADPRFKVFVGVCVVGLIVVWIVGLVDKLL